MRGLGFAGKRCSLVALLCMICQRENEYFYFTKTASFSFFFLMYYYRTI